MNTNNQPNHDDVFFQNVCSQDVYYMQIAINEAQKGSYTTRPNPAVGCVIVKDGQIIGMGYHPKAGEPHAEVFALRQAQAHHPDKLIGATAYVTLEPCSHTGRTPPCALALIDAKIARVVVAGLDPNPKVAGRGIHLLKTAGVDVCIGVLKEQAEQLNAGFLKAMKTGMPYVRLKMAVSLDGRTAMATGESKWITGPQARHDVQHLRAGSAAIITGSQTVIDDNPSLTVRSNSLGMGIDINAIQIPQPKVVVLDRRHRLNKNSPYQVCQRNDTLFWSGELGGLLKILVSEYQRHDVLVEAGSAVAGSFIEQNLIDELIIYQAPCFLGSNSRAMAEFSIDTLAKQKRYQLVSHQLVGGDLKLTLRSELSTVNKFSAEDVILAE